MDGRTDGWLTIRRSYGQTDEWMDGWNDGQLDTPPNQVTFVRLLRQIIWRLDGFRCVLAAVGSLVCPSALLSHTRFGTRMILLCGFLHFCRVHEYSYKEPSSRKSFLRRFLKKMKNSRFLAIFCIDYFSGWFDLAIDRMMLILMKFPFIW